MKLASIANLSSTIVTPWDPDQNTTPDAALKFPSKDLYREWCVDKETRHVFLSTSFGIQQGLRANKSGNELAKLGSIVAEYDASGIPDFSISPFPPNFFNRTVSGNLRVWWDLPREIPLENVAHREAFLKIFFKEVKAIKLAPGFSIEESLDVYHFYEVGWGWQRVALTSSIPEDVLQGWSFRALESKWPAERTQLPFETVRKECAARWPDVGIVWDTWSPGTRCKRFWDPNADAEAAIVSDHGLRCWTGDQAFVPWSMILGADWVRRQTDALTGSAIGGWFWESKTSRYWRKLNNSKWHSHTAQDVRLRLNAAGLSDIVPKGETVSPASKGLMAVQDTAAVHGIFPAFYNPRQIVHIAGQDYLNTSTVKIQEPSPDMCHGWGQGFPWLADYFEKLFSPEQLKYFLHWFAHAYRGGLEGNPQRGLALFIAGSVGVGKTFLNRCIFKKMFGGSEDASKYITGKDQFNSFLVGCPHWALDDATLSSEVSKKEFYSQMIKSAVANEGVIMRGMHREGFLAPWRGRLTVTMNDDPDSLKMLPHTDISNKDKLMILHARKVEIAAENWITDEQVDVEMPRFAAFLRDMPVDEKIWGGRFGVQPYLDPELVSAAESIGPTAGTREILEIWIQEYFTQYPDKTEWIGNATELDQAVSCNASLERMLHRQTKRTSDLQHDLRKIHNQACAWLEEARTPNGTRIWRIAKPT